MTQLRQKMIRAMELENLSDNTQRRYLAAVTGRRLLVFSRHHVMSR
jgi:hypothetical protein